MKQQLDLGSKLVIVGSHNSVLAQKAAHSIGCDLISFTQAHFSDTESTIILEREQDIAGASVLLFFQFYSQHAQAYINNQLFDLLLITQMLKQLGAVKISLVLPYLPYARQEKNTQSGAIVFGHLIQQAGADELIVLDVHTEKLLSLMPIPLHTLSLTHVWKSVYADFIGQDQEQICLVSPDVGGCQRVQDLQDLLQNYAGVTECSSAFIKKTRDVDGKPRVLDLVGDVTGKIVFLIDDIVDTAQTAIRACDLLLERGALKVIGFFSHAVLSSQAYEKLKVSKFERIFLTDTLVYDSSVFDKKYTVISIHDFLVQALVKALNNTNVYLTVVPRDAKHRLEG